MTGHSTREGLRLEAGTAGTEHVPEQGASMSLIGVSPACESTIRVLLVTRNLPPLRGGMERLNLHLALAVESGYQLAVSGPRGCGQHLPLVPERVVETPAGPLPVFLIGCALRSARLAAGFRPHVIIAGSGLTAPIAWVLAVLLRARSIVYLHGLDIVADNRVYRWLWMPTLRRARLAVTNSRNTARLAEAAGVARDRIRVVNPGTDLRGHDPHARRRFREQHELGERPLLLSVGRLTRRKGIAEFVEQALPELVREFPDLLLLVIGHNPRDALLGANGSEVERIASCAARMGVREAVRFLPSCDDAMLFAAYDAADVHVFPIREVPGDVEGFGMVAIEAAAHGLPTVAFAVGGVADAVIDGKTGELVGADDYAALIRAVGARLASRYDAANRGECVEAVRDFGWDRFGNRVRDLIAQSARTGAIRVSNRP